MITKQVCQEGEKRYSQQGDNILYTQTGRVLHCKCLQGGGGPCGVLGSRKKVVRNIRQYFGKNQMLWDLGLDATRMEDVNEVKRKIRELETEFDFGKYALK